MFDQFGLVAMSFGKNGDRFSLCILVYDLDKVNAMMEDDVEQARFSCIINGKTEAECLERAADLLHVAKQAVIQMQADRFNNPPLFSEN